MRFFKKKISKAITSILDRFLAFMTLQSTQKVLMAVAMILCTAVHALAADDGGAGFGAATTTIRGYQTQVANLMKAIGAVIAIVGAFNVFFKMQNGDQDVKKTIMLTIGGCIAFVALGEALPLFFGEPGV